ncbi:hypothetical protein GT755_38230 [Herbidospora sp. NEAU-GS84]|uniref:Uncharacterized protein n=1 Tax=Herbidospora solisilvae TaxID=2696284 RepID=A0A7C9NCR5_9ACTN|nr:hypothetical protein [Herbidospora solisilvae]NAS27493.1 hypothetical protein [Herbidospora solisilvae]
MILVSAALVLAAIVLLIAGVVLGMAFLVMWSIVISVLSAVCLLIGALLRRHELFPAGGRAAVEAHQAAVAPQMAPHMAPQMAHAGMPVYGAPPVMAPAAPVPPTAPPTYPPHPTVTAPVPVPGLGPDSIVLVIPGRKRFHRSGCRQLVGRETEELTVEEAREEGFTPCTTCVVDAAADDTWATTVQEARVEPADTPGRAGSVPPAASTPPVVPVVPPAAPSLESSESTAVFRAEPPSAGWPEPVPSDRSETPRPAASSGWPEPVRPAEPVARKESPARGNPYAKADSAARAKTEKEPEAASPVPAFEAAKPDDDRPEPVKPEAVKSEAGTPKAADAAKPVADEPVGAEAETASEAVKPKAEKPEAASETAKLKPVKPEAVPEAAKVEADEPEASAPSAKERSEAADGPVKPAITIPEASSSWNAFSRPAAPPTAAKEEAEEEEAGEDRDGDTVERKLPPPMVKVMEGTRRYHTPDCPLIKGDDDGIETMSQPAAEEAGLTPCTVCDKA